MTRINQQRISVRRGPRIAPRPVQTEAQVQAPGPERRRGPPIAPRPVPVQAPAPVNMNKIGGTRRKHHRRNTKKLKKRSI